MSSTAIGTLGHPHPAEAFFRAPTCVYAQDLGVSSANVLTFPPTFGARYVRLTGNLDFYVNWGSTGVSTAASTANSTGGQSLLVSLQSGGRLFDISSTLATTSASVMSTAASHITAEWWAA